jgi:tetratricopeptide (TPR) repeat protein
VQGPKAPSITRPAGTAPAPSKRPDACASPAGASLPPAKGQIAVAQILVQTGLRHLAASRFDAAAQELERAVALCPEYRDAALWLQICLARKLKMAGKGQDALAAYQAVLAIDPDHREAREYLETQAPRRGGVIGKWFGNEGT